MVSCLSDRAYNNLKNMYIFAIDSVTLFKQIPESHFSVEKLKFKNTERKLTSGAVQ